MYARSANGTTVATKHNITPSAVTVPLARPGILRQPITAVANPTKNGTKNSVLTLKIKHVVGRIAVSKPIAINGGIGFECIIIQTNLTSSGASCSRTDESSES
jgi:hypothetical protein